MTLVRAVIIVYLVLQHQGGGVLCYDIEAVRCHAFTGENCTLALRSRSSPGSSVEARSASWRKHTDNGEMIGSFNKAYNQDLGYGSDSTRTQFAINTTDGSLTIIDLTFIEDDIDFCFLGYFAYSSCGSYDYYCYSEDCVHPDIKVGVSDIKLCWAYASGSSQCVDTTGSDGGMNQVDVKVIEGVSLEMTCSTLNCIRPGATFMLLVGGRDLPLKGGKDYDCSQGLLMTSSAEVSFMPQLEDHQRRLSCTVSNREGAEYDVTVSVPLFVNVPIEESRLVINYNGNDYRSGDVVPIQSTGRERVSCTAMETRPTAEITWDFGGNPLPSSKTIYESDRDLKDTTSFVDIEIDEALNYAKLTCSAKTPDMKDPVTIFVSVVLEGSLGSTSVAAYIGGVLAVLASVALVLIAIIVVRKRKKAGKRRKDFQRRWKEAQAEFIFHSQFLAFTSTGSLRGWLKSDHWSPSLPTPGLCTNSCDSSGPPVSKRPGSYPDTSDGESRYTSLPATQPFPRSKLSILYEIGQGNFGVVYLAMATDILQTGSKTYVALKTLKDNAGENARRNLLREVEVMKKMESHPNVVRFLGCCLEKDPLYVIVEYLSNGNLQQYLRQNRSRDYTYIDALSDSVSCTDLIKFARDIAKGMAFLSSKQCIHRDLAARNVLVAGDKVCKISDFGLTCDITNCRVSQKSTNNALPLRWMALESIDSDVFTTKSDVWSFGVVLWEIVTFGARPFSDMPIREVLCKLRDGYRMPKPSHCVDKLYDMMQACWDVEPNRRPDFAWLVNLLETFLETEADYIAVELYQEAMYLTPTVLDNHLEKLL